MGLLFSVVHYVKSDDGKEGLIAPMEFADILPLPRQRITNEKASIRRLNSQMEQIHVQENGRVYEPPDAS